jgi:hypothetical protein
MVVISTLPLLNGKADLILVVVVTWMLSEHLPFTWEWPLVASLLVMFSSALPKFAPILIYFLVAGLAYYLKKRVWQTPLLMLFITVGIGSIIENVISILALKMYGNPFSWMDAIVLVSIPSLIMNLLIALPVHGILSDLANWLYASEVDG